MLKRGRPRISKIDRAEQLRRAKRAQRQRERAAGLVEIQLKLPRQIATKLKAVLSSSNCSEDLDQLLNEALIHIADYRMLADIAWNLAKPYIPAREAFALYQRNWRFVNPDKLDPAERELILRLSARYGNGVPGAISLKEQIS